MSAPAEVCDVHGKRRLLNDLYVGENGRYRCLPTKICRLDGASSHYQQGGGHHEGAGGGGGGGGGGSRDAEICVIHGKKRLVVDMALDSGGWKCLPNKICRDDNAKCRRHGRLRLMADLEPCGNGEYECKSHRVCYVTHHGGTSSNITVGSGTDDIVVGAGGPTSTTMIGGVGSAAGYQQQQQRTTLAIGVPSSSSAVVGGIAAAPAYASVLRGAGATEVWCHLHGKRIGITRAERVDEVYNVCKDRYACLTSALESVEVLAMSGCSELFCAVHGSLRSPQYMVAYGDKGYRCSANHPCTGTSSQRMLEKARRWGH